MQTSLSNLEFPLHSLIEKKFKYNFLILFLITITKNYI